MRRVLRWNLTALGILLVAIAAGATWLLGTESGLQFGVRQARALLGEQLELDSAQGRLLGPLAIRGLQWRSDSATIRLDQASLQWSPSALLAGRIQIDQLSAGALQIQLHAGAEPSDQPPQPLPDPLLPLTVQVDQLSLASLVVEPVTGEPLQIEQIALHGKLLGSHFEIDELRAQLAPTGPLRVSAQGRLLGSGVHLQTLELSGPGRVTAAGKLHWIDPRADLALAWENLHWPIGPEPQFDSPAGELKASGPLQELAVQGWLSAGAETRIEVSGRVGETLDLETRWQALRWPLRGPEAEVLARSAQGQVHWRGPLRSPTFEGDLSLASQGRITASGQLGESLQLTAKWTKLQWPLQGQPADALLRSADGQIQLSGVPDKWDFRIDGRVHHADQAGRIQAEGTGNRQGLQARKLRADALGGSLTGEGRVNWQQTQQAQATLRLRHINPGRLQKDWPGDLNGNVEAQVSWAGPLQYRARWQLKDSQLRQLPIRSEGQLQGQGEVLSLTAVSLRSGQSVVNLDGQVLPSLALKADLDSQQLNDLWPDLSGQAELQADIRGDWRLPQLQAQGRAKDVRLGALSLGQGSLNAEVSSAGAINASASVQDLNVGYQFAEAELQISGQAGDHQIRIVADGEHGRGELQLQGAYDEQALNWQGELQQGRLEPEVLAAWSLEEPSRLALSPGSALLEPACWRSQDGRLCAQLDWQAPEVLVAWRLEALELAALQPLLPADWRAEGELTGTGRVRLDDSGLAEAQVDMHSTAGALAAGPKARLDFGPSRWQISESGRGAQILAHLALPDGALDLDAALAPASRWRDRALSGQLKADWPDIAALALLSPELGEVQGALHGQFELGGSVGKPRLQGELSLAGGQLHLQTPGITLTELQAQLSAGADERISMQASARSGDGTLNLDGQWALFDTNRKIGLQVRGEQVLAVNTPEARVWVSPDLLLELEGDAARLSGTVVIPKADITPERFSGGGVGPSADQVILSEDGQRPVSEGFKLNSQVKLVLGDAVRFDGFGLKTRLSGQIEAIDRPGRLTAGRGELRLIGGRYQAYGQDLTIETGRLLFDGGPITNPSLDLRATRKPREEILVGVQVRGALNAPQLNLFSDPPMNQDAQLSWLVLGRPVGSGTDDAEREAVASAALALGLKGTDFVAGKLGTKLGLDEISVGSRPGETADQARFTIGKYLSPKLFVSYGVGLFQPGHSLQLEYDLGGGFKLFSETGVESGGDLIYTIEK